MSGTDEAMKEFVAQCVHIGVHLTPKQIDQFVTYQSLLLEWNQRLNLTAVREPALIQNRHFLDSLTCLTVTGDLNGRSLIDVGTGAGFPGLPLKIYHTELQLTLVESVSKKSRFLAAAVDALGLDNVFIVTERIELLGRQPEHREHYDWAVARGVAEMRVLVEYLLPLCRVGGHLLAQKGDQAATETAAAAHAIQLLGGGKPQLHPVQLPQYEKRHFLVVIEKVQQTPDNYPRRVGVPKKRPL